MTDRDTLPDPRWITPGNAARALGITTEHLARLADRGDIQSMRRPGGHRRYAAADIEAIIAREPWDAS